MPVTVDQIREFAASLPRSYKAIVRGRVKFRIGQIVYLPDRLSVCRAREYQNQPTSAAVPEKRDLG